MSRLWAFTGMASTFLLGVILATLVMAFLFVVQRNTLQQSNFLRDFQFKSLLERASSPGTSWTEVDAGGIFYTGAGSRTGMGRRFAAQCTMPNATDRTKFFAEFDSRIQTSMTPYGGLIYRSTTASSATMAPSVPPPPGPEGSVPASPGSESTAPGSTPLQWTMSTMPYSVDGRSGCVHVLYITQGEQVFVTVIIQERPDHRN